MSRAGNAMARARAIATAALSGALLGGLAGQAAAATPTPAVPAVSAETYILLDSDSNQSLAERHADQRTPPASLSKLMTSYILSAQLRSGHVSAADTARISRNAWAQNPKLAGGSVMFLEAGSRVRIDALHQGLIVASGNDASIAIAEHLAGSEEAFVNLMNKQAQELGMTDTHFTNVHGLPSSGHYTTARDMAALARALVRNFPEQYPLYRQKHFSWNGIAQKNRNGLLWVSSAVDGLKSGYTEEAGYCLVASAEKDGMRLIAVTMRSNSERARDRDSQRLLSHGFRFYRTMRLYPADAVLITPRIWGGKQTRLPIGIVEPLHITIPKGHENRLQQPITIDPYLDAPVSKGDVVAELDVQLDGQSLARRHLFAMESVERGNMFSRAGDAMLQLFARLFQ